MKHIVPILLLLCLAFVVWCLLLIPRRCHGDWGALAGHRYAHRGLHDDTRGIAENSLAAFRAAAEGGFGAELDVHLLADGALAVFHDSSLQRMCGAPVRIEDLTALQLPDYPLRGTGETIPLLEQVLAVFEGKGPLIIELKVVDGNAAPLTDAVMQALEGWQGAYCLESFHPGALLHLKRHYPQVIRGQLSENFLKRGTSMPLHQRLLLTALLTTTATGPDFIAYRWQDRSCVSLRLMRALYGVKEVSWTVPDRQTLEQLEGEGVIPIFEGFVP